MDEPNIIRDTLMEELERNERSQYIYAQEIERLPKGSLTIRMRRGLPYCYLKYRQGSKVVTKYVGPEKQVGEDLRLQIEKRRSLQATLRRLKREHAFIVRALGKEHNEA